ncbi:lipoprotein [Fontimonas sp. SYSU GA230001]
MLRTLLLCTLLLAACGQAGPLYLPEQSAAPAATSAPTPSPSTAP